MTDTRVLLTVTTPTLTRERIANFAEASGDSNPIHVDRVVARAAGHHDIIAHGMLVMAHAGNALSRLVGVGGIQSFTARFVAVTPVDSTLSIQISSVGSAESANDEIVELVLGVHRDDGVTVMTGRALVRSDDLPALAGSTDSGGVQA